MSIRSQRELEAMQRVGTLVGRILREAAAHVREGITTGDLDALVGRHLAAEGARSGPALVYNFPGHVCISVNHEALHGIPGERRINPGDVVKLDLTAELNGYFADAAVTVLVPPVADDARHLLATTREALRQGLRAAQAGRRVREIGKAVEHEARRGRTGVLRQYAGHGIGRTIHEQPTVPNYDEPHARQRLTEGLVITIEPILSLGSGDAEVAPDQWTVRTADATLAAHVEHTVVITRGQPLLLTAA